MAGYRSIPAVRQINDMACWAASLKWWYKAAMSINASQTKLWDRYKARATQQGGLPDGDMKHLIRENGMKLLEFQTASTFTYSKILNLLLCGPIYIAFTELGTNKRHVNVIYGITGSDAWADVSAMEPQWRPHTGADWKGKHISRGLADYNTVGSIWAGVHREAYDTWMLITDGNF
ncbi:MAG TPA: papain-like cysteine protease family protein [Pyrinomonadaceae bacterium]|nr:papain-like cysteine protease family protein [Pyrinomonadaceae bacterium]